MVTIYVMRNYRDWGMLESGGIVRFLSVFIVLDLSIGVWRDDGMKEKNTLCDNV
jgi:hypothetical protein